MKMCVSDKNGIIWYLVIYDKLAIVHVCIEHGSLTSYATNMQFLYVKY